MRFNGEVVLVTGSSRGLGQAFADCIAAAGATVVINSTGRTDQGDVFAEQLNARGDRAVHIPMQVERGAELVAKVVETTGRIDAIVHNAGFVQDKTLKKLPEEAWHAVVDNHLTAAFLLTQAAWPHFVEQARGRLVFISSASALYGNFGQANYAAAKAGLYGLARTIVLEGGKYDIRANCVAPVGATEMNSATWDEARKAITQPAFIAPLIGYLAHPDCQANGGLFEASGGAFKQLRWQRSMGLRLDRGQPMAIADIAAGWDQINDFTDVEYPADMAESIASMLGG